MAQSVKFQLRRDTAAAWAGNNPILALGEPGYAVVDGTTGGNRMKIGNGQTGWNSLPYVDCGTTGPTGPGFTGPTGPTGTPGQGSWTSQLIGTVIQSTTRAGTFIKIGPTGWDSSVRSVQSFSDGAYVSFVGTTGPNLVGLNDTARTPSGSASDIAYSIALNSNPNTITLYQNGATVGISGASGWTGGDSFAVKYDGTNVRYYQNGNIIGTPVARSIGLPLFLDSQFNNTNTQVDNLVFGAGGGGGGGGTLGATGPTGIGPTGPTGVVGPIANADNTITALDSFTVGNSYRSLITDTTPTEPWMTLNTVPAITFTPQGYRPYQDYHVNLSGLTIIPNDSGGVTGNTGGKAGTAALSISNNPVPGRTSIGLTLYVPATTVGGLTQDVPCLFMYGGTVTPIAQIWSINPATGVTNFNYPVTAPNISVISPTPIFISPMNFPGSSVNTAIFNTVAYPALVVGATYMMIWSDGLGVHSQGTFAIVANTPPTNPPLFSGMNFSSTFSEAGVTAVTVSGNGGSDFFVEITGKTVASTGFATINRMT